MGGETAGATVHDPFGNEIQGGFALVEGGGTAIVEAAEASGLQFGKDPWKATTHGTGELLCAAADSGAAVILLGVGGSATTDGGAGALEAIAEHGGLGGAKLVVLCDVRTPWERCAEVFAPQKGADDAMVRRLAERLEALASELPRDPRGIAMTGAAGGLAGGLWAAHGAALEAGAPFVLDALDFIARMHPARCVITGEGGLDEQSLQGKVVGEIGTRTRQNGVPLHAIVGSDALDPFGKRMIDLQVVVEASTLDEIEASAHRLGALIRAGRA
jgi:glycerate kinase